MIDRVLSWFREARRWHREHLEAWSGATTPEQDGFSRFQRECESKLTTFLATVGTQLAERTVKSEKFDEKRNENVVFARVDGTGIEIWILSDGAQIGGPGIDERFEEWGSLSPADLTTSFCSAVGELIPKHRTGGA